VSWVVFPPYKQEKRQSTFESSAGSRPYRSVTYSSQFVTMIFESIKSIIVVCSILSESFDARNCDGVQDPVSEYFVVVVRDITDTYFSKFGTTAIFSESWCLSRRPWCESWYQNCLINECSTSLKVLKIWQAFLTSTWRSIRNKSNERHSRL